jgi:hypothetical protein
MDRRTFLAAAAAVLSLPLARPRRPRRRGFGAGPFGAGPFGS